MLPKQRSITRDKLFVGLSFMGQIGHRHYCVVDTCPTGDVSISKLEWRLSSKEEWQHRFSKGPQNHICFHSRDKALYWPPSLWWEQRRTSGAVVTEGQSPLWEEVGKDGHLPAFHKPIAQWMAILKCHYWLWFCPSDWVNEPSSSPIFTVITEDSSIRRNPVSIEQ